MAARAVQLQEKSRTLRNAGKRKAESASFSRRKKTMGKDKAIYSNAYGEGLQRANLQDLEDSGMLIDEEVADSEE